MRLRLAAALLADQGVVAEPVAETKPAKKKAAKKKAAKKTIVGKPTEESTSEFELDDLRTALKTLKSEVSQAAVKSLLKKYGASTIGQVDVKHYAQLIGDAEEQSE